MGGLASPLLLRRGLVGRRNRQAGGLHFSLLARLRGRRRSNCRASGEMSGCGLDGHTKRRKARLDLVVSNIHPLATLGDDGVARNIF